MTNEPVSDALLEQAARFRARLADRPRDTALRRQVGEWRDTDPAHEQAFVEAERIWAIAGPPAAASAHARRQGHWGWPAVAAASVVALLLTPTIRQNIDNLRSDAVVGTGARRDIALTDGSRVAVNSDTALAFDLSDKQREVRMYRGEAFFAVARDPAHPFRIRAGDATVTVLGTHFNVRMSAGETRVTVEEGHVRVEGPTETRDLTAGMQGIAVAGHVTARAVESADETAWQRGRSVYYDAPLPRVIADLERYRGGTIWLASDNARTRRVTGAFRTDAPDETLDAIRDTLGLHRLTLPGLVVLY